jgi:methanogenic corrinoid protein MtbC1
MLDAIPSEVSPEAAITSVLVPAQREIGQLWHMGSASISEERLVSETTRDVLSLILARFAPEASAGRKLLAASVAGNAHDIGLRAVTSLFRLDGWRTVFLGADMPTDEIAKAAQSFDVSLIVLSATLTTQLKTLADAIEQIKQADDAPPVLVGGLALEDSGGLWQELGADAYAPAIADAVAVGSKLVGDAQ